MLKKEATNAKAQSDSECADADYGDGVSSPKFVFTNWRSLQFEKGGA